MYEDSLIKNTGVKFKSVGVMVTIVLVRVPYFCRGVSFRYRCFVNPSLYEKRPLHKDKFTFVQQPRLSDGAPGGIRTLAPRLRRPLLYPTELQVHGRDDRI